MPFLIAHQRVFSSLNMCIIGGLFILSHNLWVLNSHPCAAGRRGADLPQTASMMTRESPNMFAPTMPRQCPAYRPPHRAMSSARILFPLPPCQRMWMHSSPDILIHAPHPIKPPWQAPSKKIAGRAIGCGLNLWDPSTMPTSEVTRWLIHLIRAECMCANENTQASNIIRFLANQTSHIRKKKAEIETYQEICPNKELPPKSSVESM